jgi:hypothetical protein
VLWLGSEQDEHLHSLACDLLFVAVPELHWVVTYSKWLAIW